MTEPDRTLLPSCAMGVNWTLAGDQHAGKDHVLFGNDLGC
jgi:hypothetical protein